MMLSRAVLNHRKSNKVEPSWLIPQKFEADLELSNVLIKH